MVRIIDELSYVELNAKLDKVIELLVERQTLNTSKMNWLTNDQLSVILNVSLRTLQNYRDEGLIGFSKVGRRILYKQSDVELFLEHRYNTPFLLKRRSKKGSKEKFMDFNLLKNATRD